jgi:bifunctional ADP-heptose synthase (sugar kinase/adenylyltransferase)
MITLSEHGIYVDYNNNSFIVPSVAVNISDVSGAGDTVISASSLAISSKEFNQKYSIKDMAIFSNLCAAQVCEKPGVVPVNLDELF